MNIIIIFLGIFLSFKAVRSLWYIDSDVAALGVFVKGYHDNGWDFVKSFHFPIDNWLFSIIIPDGILIRIFGEYSSILLLTGLFAFWGTALCSAFLVSYLAGVKRGLWTGALILSAPAMALGQGGFLAYPVAHNVSVAWGLVALLLCVLWLRRSSLPALLGAFVLFSLSAFSDPWLFPAFILPLVCAGCLLLFLQKGRQAGQYIPFIGLAFCVVVLCKTHFFGVLDIEQTNVKSLAKLRFSLFSLPAMAGALSYYFNFVPFCNFNKFYMAVSAMDKKSIGFFIICMVVNFIAMVFILTRLAKKVWQQRAGMDKETFFVCLFLFFSVLGIISSSFVFGGMRTIETSRYIVNIYYCVIIFVCLLPYEKLTPWLRNALFFLGGMWMISSMVSNYEIWNKASPVAHGETGDVLSVLRQERIRYAFGDYWGLDAHALTWQSHESVKARPLLYTQEYRGFLPAIWSSPFWYQLPAHVRWAFVVTGLREDRICPPYPSCREAVIHQFGQPLAIREEKRFLFFIYDSDTTHLPADMNVENWRNPLPLSPTSFPRWRSFHPNGEMNGGDLVTLDGWDDVKHGQVESLAEVAHIGLPVVTTQGHLARMWLHLSSASVQDRDIDIIYKGKTITRWKVGPKETVHYLELPFENGQTSLEYDISILNPDHGRHNALRGIRLYEVQMIMEDGHL